MYPLQDAQAKHEASAARKVLLELIENAGNGGIEELKDAAAPKLDSQILFEDTVDTLRNLHDAYLSMNEKYEAEIANAERLEAELLRGQCGGPAGDLVQAGEGVREQGGGGVEGCVHAGSSAYWAGVREGV